MATYGLPGRTTARPELIAAFKKVVDTMTAKVNGVAVDENQAKRRLNSAQENVKSRLGGLRSTIEKARQYGSKKGAATPAQLKAWDALAARALAGEGGAEVRVPPKYGGRMAIGHSSSEVVRGLNAIFKDVTGRSFDLRRPGQRGPPVVLVDQEPGRHERARRGGAVGRDRAAPRRHGVLDEAKKIDGFRASDYWSTPHEMGARAFESYIFDKIAGATKSSQYLVHAVENKYYALLDMKPYPEGAERKAINAAFDELFKAIQAEPTDRGVALREGVAEYNSVVEQAKSNGYQQELDLSGPRGSAQSAAKRETRAAAAPAAAAASPAARPFVVLRKTGEVVRTGFARVTTPEQAAHVFAGLRKQPREWFTVLMTDAQGKPVGISHMFKGAIAQTAAYPGEILKLAHATPGAKKIWIAHNHPSGIAVPSRADEMLTEAIDRGYGKDFGIELAGHVIVAGTKFTTVSPYGHGAPAGAPIPAKARTFSIPVVDRVVVGAPKEVETMSSPAEAKRIVNERLFGKEAGIVWMGSQNQVLGADPMSVADMRTLRGGGFAKLMQRWSAVNAASVILKAPDTIDGGKAVENLSAAFARPGTDVRVLDAMMEMNGRLKSLAESGGMPSGRNTDVYSLGDKPPVFYSALERAIPKMPFGKNGVQASILRNWLEARSKDGTIKPDELTWSGITDWLGMQQGNVTREQVAQFIANNGVKVTETELGDGNEGLTAEAQRAYDSLVEAGYNVENDDYHWSIEKDGAGVDPDEMPRNLRAAWNVVRNADPVGEVGGTKFATYTLPGGENYRELLLTLPKKEAPKMTSSTVAELKAAGWTVTDLEYSRFNHQTSYTIRDSDGDMVAMRSGARGEFTADQAMQSYLDSQAEGKQREADKAANFRSGHFDQPNILAHIRFNERTDAEWRQAVLFIEEIQSDWAQKGKQAGVCVKRQNPRRLARREGRATRSNQTEPVHRYRRGRIPGRTVRP
jgi:hypothetical protein